MCIRDRRTGIGTQRLRTTCKRKLAAVCHIALAAAELRQPPQRVSVHRLKHAEKRSKQGEHSPDFIASCSNTS
eukprot:3771752-Amphidinium_carterae.1